MKASKCRKFLVILPVVLGALLLTLNGPRNPFANAGGQGGGQFSGKIECARQPVAGSTVTLFAASEGKPTQIAQAKTGDDGAFKLDIAADAADKVLYLVARGGTPKAAKD